MRSLQLKNWINVLVAGVFLFALPIDKVAAQSWPPDKMTVVIPHGVGGTTNALARGLGDIWAGYLGTTFVYENKKGASTRIGHDYFLRQPADGSVLLAGNLSTAAIMYAQQKPDWNWEESIQPIGIYSIDPAVIFVAKDSPYQTFADFLEAAKASPKTFAVSQWQSEDTLLLHQIMDKTGAQFEIIPHDVSTQALSQVMGGNIDIGILKVGPVSNAGDAVRMLAVTLPENLIKSLTNDAPTVGEVMNVDVMSVASYRAFSVHKELAEKYPDRVQTLSDTFYQAVSDQRYIDAMRKAANSPELLSRMDSEMIKTKILDPVWAAYAQFGEVFSK
ncbi:MAG: tripartite tricarboxylate transporter substrate binding protein [Pseudorhodobacter sp.]|nr:tripartite tricarboxylate transporter substrate binding protein [Pseudorhodobacter sp.]